MSGPVEDTLDLARMAVERKAITIEGECRRRIEERYPPYIQLQITGAVMALDLERRKHGSIDTVIVSQLERDAGELPRMMKCIALHKLAARSLADYVARPGVDPNTISPSDDGYWPKAGDFGDLKWCA